MSDFKILLVGTSGVTDITRTATGMPQNLPEDERVEMTDWDKWIGFWDRVDKAMAKKYGKENNNGNNR